MPAWQFDSYCAQAHRIFFKWERMQAAGFLSITGMNRSRKIRCNSRYLLNPRQFFGAPNSRSWGWTPPVQGSRSWRWGLQGAQLIWWTLGGAGERCQRCQDAISRLELEPEEICAFAEKRQSAISLLCSCNIQVQFTFKPVLCKVRLVVMLKFRKRGSGIKNCKRLKDVKRVFGEDRWSGIDFLHIFWLGLWTYYDLI